MHDQITDSARISPLVIVPGNQFEEMIVQRNAGLLVEDARLVGRNEVR